VVKCCSTWHDVENKNRWTESQFAADSELALGGVASKDGQDNVGRTALHLAAKCGSDSRTRLLLESGTVEVDLRDEFGLTPLSRVAENGHEAVATLLLEKGADPSAEDKEGLTPLSWAAKMGQDAVLRLLLEGGHMEPNRKDNRYGQNTVVMGRGEGTRRRGFDASAAR